MGKRILIDTSKTEETRIAVTADDKLDSVPDFRVDTPAGFFIEKSEKRNETPKCSSRFMAPPAK